MKTKILLFAVIFAWISPINAQQQDKLLQTLKGELDYSFTLTAACILALSYMAQAKS